MVKRSAIQESRFPGLRIVARSAIQRKRSLMHFWFSMTVDTFTWQIFELALGVASHTADLQMRIKKRKFRIAMIKPGHVVSPVMTIYAIRPKILQVGSHEAKIIAGVANGARFA
jgi:hypothetical protein